MFCMLWILVIVGEIRGESVTEYVDSLVHPSVYNKKERPNFGQGKPVLVDVDVYVNSISAISVVTMDYSINMYLRQRWRDPRLSLVNENHTNPINYTVTLHYDLRHHIWLPDLFIRNEQTEGSFHQITVPNVLLELSPQGDILYSQRVSTKLACHMTLRNYPLDSQECALIFESYGYTTRDLLFRWHKKENAVQVNDLLELPEFNLTGVNTEVCTKQYVTGTFSCISAQFHFSRLFAYYLIQIYLPSILIVILSWVSFWIDIHAVPARITLGLLTVLTITTQMSGISSSLPKVSYIKAIDVWMFTNMIFVFGALIEFSIVNVLARTHRVKLEAMLDKKAQDEEYEQHQVKSVQKNGLSNGNYSNGKPGVFKENRPYANNTYDEDASTKYTDYYPAEMSFCEKVKFNRALATDVISRIFFPGAYVIFNCLYWFIY